MNFNIAVLAGDGIGPEISRQAVAVMKAVCQVAGHSVKFTDALVGAAAIDAVGDPFPPETEKLCLDSDAILFSAVGDPKYDLDPKSAPNRDCSSCAKSWDFSPISARCRHSHLCFTSLRCGLNWSPVPILSA